MNPYNLKDLIVVLFLLQFPLAGWIGGGWKGLIIASVLTLVVAWRLSRDTWPPSF